MKKLFICILSLAVAAPVFYGCNKDEVSIVYEDPNLGNDDDEPQPPATAKVKLLADEVLLGAASNKTSNIIVVTNQDVLSLEKATPTEDISWFDVSFVGREMYLTTKSDNEAAVRKTANVILKAGEGDNTASFPFKIEQITVEEEDTYISVALDVYAVSGRAGSSIKISLNTNRRVFSISPADESWYKTTFDNDKRELTIEVLEDNSTGALRDAVVTVTAGEAPKTADVTFTIRQELKPALDPLVGQPLGGGIVFWVSGDKSKCLVLAKEEHAGKFGSARHASVGATNVSDGKANMEAYKAASADLSLYPAEQFCNNVAPSGNWFVPAGNEMATLIDAIVEFGQTDFETAFAAMGGTPITGAYHWVSNESEAATTQNVVRWPDKGKSSFQKDGNRYARCIREMSYPAVP